MLDEVILYELNKLKETENLSSLPNNKEEALKIGSEFYFTGEKCKYNHLDKRKTNTGHCFLCSKRYSETESKKTKKKREDKKIKKLFANVIFDFIAKKEFDELSKLPKTKQEAKEKRLTRFFNGWPCQKGHWAAKTSANGSCTKCILERERFIRENRTEEEKEKYRQKENDRNAKNRDHRNALARGARAKRIDEVRKKRNEYMAKKRKESFYKVHASITTGIYNSLKNYGFVKNNYKWETFVNYTLEDLVKHLEKQFTPEMNWDNYGSYWHIDHIKPKSLCESFEECWVLDNLQPLMAFDNISKHNRYIGHPNNPQWIDKKDKDNE